MLFDSYSQTISQKGYFAGEDDGIATAGGVPAQRDIVLQDPHDYSVLAIGESLPNGRWMFYNLPLGKEYLIMIRDYEKDHEPFCYDWIKPFEAATLDEPKSIWGSWQ